MEFVTKDQFLSNANLNAQEFQNRQILIVGSGAPDFQAPKHVEYEDDSTFPSTRYRKTGDGLGDWTNIGLTRLLGFGQEENSIVVQASSSEPGVNFSITLPGNLTGNVLVTIQGYGSGAVLDSIIGGFPGLILRLQRNEVDSLTIHPSGGLKISSTIQMDDAENLNNLTVQRIEPNVWLEISRTTF